jgi:hypothetical protein
MEFPAVCGELLIPGRSVIRHTQPAAHAEGPLIANDFVDAWALDNPANCRHLHLMADSNRELAEKMDVIT